MSGAPPPVTVEPVGPERRETLANLFQLYAHDFSLQWASAPRPEGQPGEDGRLPAYPWLDAYWDEPDRAALLIRHGGAVAGFALVNAISHAGREIDRNMAEFFVVRMHRRAGVGLAAARATFARLPGRWEVAVARTNPDALAFWRRAVTDCPGLHGLEEADAAGQGWDGPMFHFTSTAPA